MKKKKGQKLGIVGNPQTRKEKQEIKIDGLDPGEVRSKGYIPKIVIAPKLSDLKAVQFEFFAACGIAIAGMKICSVDEAVEAKLPIRAAQKANLEKEAFPVYLTNGVDELIPEDYKDPQIPVNLDSVVFTSDKIPGRNDLCFCKSGKKYKKCCMNNIN